MFCNVVKETEHCFFSKISLQSLQKNVNDIDQTIQYDLCNYWIHINCNSLNYIDYKFFKIPMTLGTVFSVAANSMKSNKKFSMCVSNFHNNNKPVKTLNNESSVLLKSSENLK